MNMNSGRATNANSSMETPRSPRMPHNAELQFCTIGLHHGSPFTKPAPGGMLVKPHRDAASGATAIQLAMTGDAGVRKPVDCSQEPALMSKLSNNPS